MKIENYQLLQPHPLCLAIPEMTDEEFADLKMDISGSGQLQPIVIFAGQILDGRHRFRACLELDIEPWFKQYDGPDSPADYVISSNLRRRHLTPSQMAIAMAEIAKVENGSNRYKTAIIEQNQQLTSESSENGLGGAIAPPKTITNAKAAEIAGVDVATVKRAKTVINNGSPELVAAMKEGKVAISAAAGIVKALPDKGEQNKALKAVTEEKVKPKAAVERVKQPAGAGGNGILLADWDWQPIAVPTDKKFNLQNNDSIGWAAYSWNPITGCTLGCEYCYARDIAARYYDKRIGFNVAVYPDRMLIPYNKQPKAPNNRVFVCSMSDLFAAEVPAAWIEEVLRVCSENPQFEFMLLTKQPKRLTDFSYPDNCWIGTTTDTQRRMDVAESIFKRVDAKKKWLSVEPMLEAVMPKDAGFANWYAIGGATDGSRVSYSPPWDWVFRLALAAKDAGAAVWIKDNFWSQGRPLEM